MCHIFIVKIPFRYIEYIHANCVYLQIYLVGNVGRYVHLVGAQNYYLMYEVAVLAYNDYGEGPMSPVATIRSAMGRQYCDKL